jgi:hypothetical protein
MPMLHVRNLLVTDVENLLTDFAQQITAQLMSRGVPRSMRIRMPSPKREQIVRLSRLADETNELITNS